MTNTSIFNFIDRKTGNITIEKISEIIKKGHLPTQNPPLKETIEKIRSDKAHSMLLNTLPYFTPSGQFNGSNDSENISQYSQVVALIFNKIPLADLPDLRQKIETSQHTLMCFLTPTGDGLSVLIRVDSELDDHDTAYSQVNDLYFDLTGSRSAYKFGDVSKAVFFSFDEDIYFNSDSIVFKVLNEAFYRAVKFTEKELTYSDQNKSQFTEELARNCNYNGIEEYDAIDYIINCYGKNSLSRSKVRQIVESIYEKHSKEFGAISKSLEFYLNSKYEFRYNMITHYIEFKQIEEDHFRSIDSDYKLNTLWREIKKAGIRVTTKELTNTLISDFSTYYNPFKEYFNGLHEWDGHDYISDLAHTVKTDDNEFWKDALRRFLVGMVGSLLVDKIVNQSVIIFSGKQGIGKSKWFNRLLPKELSKYKYSGLINPNNKDALIYMSTMALIDLDELESLSKQQSKSMKELITKSEIKLRRPYGSIYEHMPRRASFVGSVNDNFFLHDITGNRRFLCFRTLEIDYEHDVDMNNVFSHAFALFNKHEKWYYDGSEIDMINEKNERFRVQSNIENLIKSLYRPVQSKVDSDFYGTSTDLLKILTDEGHIRVNETSNIEVGKVLSSMIDKPTISGGVKKYALKRKSANQDSEQEEGIAPEVREISERLDLELGF